MKKIIACFVALLTVLTLVACGEEQESKQNAEINIWATAAEEAVIKAVIDEYNAAHSSKYTFKFTAISEADAGTTLANDPTIKGAPALFLCADDHLSTLQSKNIVAEIKGARKERVEASTTPVSVASASLNGKLYGYPVTSDNGYFLWYDKSQISADQVTTLESILAVAAQKGKTFLMDVPNGWYANSFIMSPQVMGNESLRWGANADGKTVYTTTWDDAKAAKASEAVANLLTPAYTAGTLQIGSNDVIEQGFKEGTMIAAVSGTWMENPLKAAIGDNLAACKLPTYNVDGQACQMASFTGTKVYCINKTRPVEEQIVAAEIAEILTSKEAQLKRFEIRASIPCNIEASQDARYTEHVSIGAKALLDQNAFACVQALTAEARYWDIGKAIGQAYIDSRLGDYANWQAFLKAQMDVLRNPAV